MKKILLSLALSITATFLFAQDNIEKTDKRPSNIISLNLLGDISTLSINYERLFWVDPTLFGTAKIGIGFNKRLNLLGDTFSQPTTFPTIPIHLTANIGKGDHFFEFGLGGTMLLKSNVQDYLLYPILGYRMVLLKSQGINFRIFALYPMDRVRLSRDYNNIHCPWFGINLGIGL